jgi:signal transduction histidine kinase/ligand-binding sensor domain-containing protein/DNA-binding response OmpR family regulator
MRIAIIKQIIALLLVFTSVSLFAAEYDVTSYLGIEQGLSNNSVRCIFQDHRGFMWFGTYDGLNRYDGYSFKVFRNNFKSAATLINNWINAIDEDPYGNIWVGTRQGLCIYHNLLDNFSPLYFTTRNSKQKVSSIIRDIERDGQGNMFVGTADIGLLLISKGDTIATQVQLANQQRDDKLHDIAAIKQGPGNKLWVLVHDLGLCLYDYKLKKLRLVNSTVTSANCLETNGNILWVGTSNGVYRYNIQTNSYDKLYNESNGLNNKDIVGLTLDKSNKLWCATNGGGITIFDVQDNYFTHLTASRETHSISSNSVSAIWEDNDKRIWIGSLRGGINIIDDHKKIFHTIVSVPGASNTLVSNYIFSFYEDPFCTLWIGTDGDGLSLWDRKSNKFTNFKHNPSDPASLSNDFVTSIIGDNQNNIWIATYRGEINLYKGNGRFEHINFNNSSSTSDAGKPLAYSLLKDNQKNIWAGSLQWGLFKYNVQKNAFDLFDSRLKDLFVLVEDNANVLWGGNLSQLVEIDPVNKKHHYFLIGKPVRSVHEDKSGNFWVGTEGGGLVLFDRKQSKITARYTTDEGLCSNSVLNILEDKSGDLWISTFNGISRFNSHNKTFTNYYQSDGLQSNQFNYNAALKLKSGELVFGGIKGFTFFNAAKILSETSTPKILFTDIKVNNTPIEKDNSLITSSNGNDIEAIKIPFNKAVLSIEFAALEYSAPDKIQYAYYLDGWDRGWNYTDKIRTAIYTHLSEGSYTLRVKSTNAEGTWSNQELKLKIIILPPWYRSWWAYFLYTILVAGAVYGFYNYRVKQTSLKYELKIANLNAETERAEKQVSLAELEKERIQREKKEAELAVEKLEKEKERAEKEREQVEREKERILNEQERELNEKKISFFTNISHEFRTPLTLIINPIKDLLNKNENGQTKPFSELVTIYRNARRMLSLVDQLLLFRKAESGLDSIKPSKLNLYSLASEVYLCFTQQAKSKNINYIFDCPNQQLEIYADKEKLEIILYNLLSNAIKYTPSEGQISFTILDHYDKVIIQVQDTGAGIPKEIGNKLFDKFYKAERAITSSKAGFGIGLFLVKHFTEQHKGSISYQSDEGMGATFILNLPNGKSHFGQEVIVSEHESGPVFLEEIKEDPIISEDLNEEKLPKADIVTEKQTILVVDDDDQIRNYLAQRFKQKYIIQQAENGEKGLKAAQKYLPDLIISDVHMQHMNGIDLCKKIKESESLNHIPVILLTASTSDELKLKGVEGGADDYITKPFDNTLLTARVTNLLKSRNNLQKYFYNEITLNRDNQRISPEYKEFLEKCITVVESHLDSDDMNVKTLTKEMGMSHSNLYRKVKSVSGQPINVFIRFIRLRKAAELFINTNYNVNETALMVGINDMRYFREQFNKLFGMNPSEYIRKYRNVHGKQFTVDRESINPDVS